MHDHDLSTPSTFLRARAAVAALVSVIVLVTILSCSQSTAPVVPPTVDFLLNLHLCSSIIPVQFTIDGNVVGTDTFRIGLLNPHVRSPLYATTRGVHVLDVQATNFGSWGSKTVYLTAGTAYTDTLGGSCS